jgi:flagellar brake protein
MDHHPELEKWHDYRVQSRREIVALLRQIADKRQLVRLLLRGEADVCVTSILEVAPESDALVLDRPVDRDQMRRLLDDARVAGETSLDKIRILFDLEGVVETSFEGGAAIAAAIPATLVRLQRREYYRMETPLTNPVRVLVPLPPELGGGTQAFPLADISCGGIALLDNKLVLGEDAPGRQFPGCSIELPEIGPVATSLEVRNQHDVTLPNNKTIRRLGCQFGGISRGHLADVQRYINKLERERNARLAGLG